jgi:hypothetical protein
LHETELPTMPLGGLPREIVRRSPRGGMIATACQGERNPNPRGQSMDYTEQTGRANGQTFRPNRPASDDE